MEIALIVVLALSNVFFVTLHRQEKARLSVLTSETECFDIGNELENKVSLNNSGASMEKLDLWIVCEKRRQADLEAEKAEADNHAAHLLDEYR